MNIDAVEDHCLWFKRNIKNIEHQNYDEYVKKYRGEFLFKRKLKLFFLICSNIKQAREAAAASWVCLMADAVAYFVYVHQIYTER